MLYEINNLFSMHLFGYLSVRAGLAFLLAFLLVLILMPKYLVWAISKNANQPISKYVAAHANKGKTPTMGGAVFLVATLIAAFIVIDLANPYVWGGLITLVGFGLVGFKDDVGKILSGDNLEGLTPKQKMGLQALVAAMATGLLVYVGFPTEFYVPFVKAPLFDMGYFAIPFWVLMFLATTNAVNLTDGLDGLATVPSITALITLGAIVYITGHTLAANYLLVPHINGVGELIVLAFALAGALLGFLWYNCYPAEIFMGDTGSLAIGGFLAYLAILGKSEILLILIGFVFVMETVSVILQVGSYKLRKKRIFRMAPIHHHFELKEWAENKIIVRFWMISFLSNILALITFKFR
jgi:phospho-N-acetylmuramoyl-pentapeptide-transferase